MSLTSESRNLSSEIASALLTSNFQFLNIGGLPMPNTTQSASWDFNPTDPVRLAASFSFDTQDTQDSAPVAAALAAIQARLASAALTATQPDGATINIAVTSEGEVTDTNAELLEESLFLPESASSLCPPCLCGKSAFSSSGLTN